MNQQTTSVPDPGPSRAIRVAAVGFAIFIALTIYAANTGASHPGLVLVRALPYGDKIGHFTLWGMLTAIVNLALPRRTVSLWVGTIPLGTAVLTCLVIVEEASQRWIDNRTLDGVDLLANLLGIATATVVVRLLGPMLSRRKG